MDDLANVGGRVLGGLLSANEIYHGGVMRYLANRNALLQDPSLRQSLGPFGAGLLQVGGQQAPQFNQAQTITQETPLGPTTGLSGTPAERAMTGAGIQPGGFVPNLPPLNPEQQVKSRLGRGAMELLGQPGVAERAAAHELGIFPTNPDLMATNVPGIFRDPVSGRPIKASGTTGEVPELVPSGVPGLLRAGNRFIRDPRVPAAKATGGEAAINTPFKLWRESHPRGTYDQYIADKAKESEAVKMSGPATVQIEQELQQVRTLDELTKDMLGALDKPEVKSQLGIISGRAGFLKYKAGLAQNPLENEFITLRELVRVLAVGRLARAAGSRSAIIWQDLNIHPPQAGDQPQLIRDKLIQLRRALHDTAENAATVARTPRSRLGGLVPEETPPPGGAAPPAGMQTTPGGNQFRVLGQ